MAEQETVIESENDVRTSLTCHKITTITTDKNDLDITPANVCTDIIASTSIGDGIMTNRDNVESDDVSGDVTMATFTRTGDNSSVSNAQLITGAAVTDSAEGFGLVSQPTSWNVHVCDSADQGSHPVHSEHESEPPCVETTTSTTAPPDHAITRHTQMTTGDIFPELLVPDSVLEGLLSGQVTQASGYCEPLDDAPVVDASNDDNDIGQEPMPNIKHTDEMAAKNDEMDGRSSGSVRTKAISYKYSYKMDHPHRGICVIINNKTFSRSVDVGDRPGTDKDAAHLYAVFKQLGFTVKCYPDLTCVQMRVAMRYYASEVDYRESDCFACCILSHGHDGGMVYGIDGYISLDKLISPFKTSSGATSLAGKPKLFFIQACRGAQTDSGVTLTDEEDSSDAPVPQRSYAIPIEADFLYAYSTVPGYLSWRNSQNGSWFVQALYDVLNQYGHCRDIMWILTRVNHQVAHNFTSTHPEPLMANKKQIPTIVSTLTKELFLTRRETTFFTKESMV